MDAFYKSPGFYFEDIHGARKISIVDPDWVHPLIDITLQPGEQRVIEGELIVNDTEEPVVLSGVQDPDASPPLIEVDNPECAIPADAVFVPEADYLALLEGQEQHKRIRPNENGYPVLEDRHAAPPTVGELKASIDNRVAQIYANWTRFQQEYLDREKAAQAYKDAGYTGDCSIYVTAFASAAGLSNATAADLILQQAAGLRSAQEQLSVQRMRKYELDQELGDDLMPRFNNIMAAIEQIAGAIN